MVADACRVPLTVVIVKFADALPEGIDTAAGILARFRLLFDNLTIRPAAGADAVRITVPIDVPRPATVVGLRVNEARVADGDTGDGNKVIDADFVTLL